MLKTIEQVLKEGKSILKEKLDCIYANPSLDAELLLLEVLKIQKIQLFTCSKQEVEQKDYDKYIELLNKRIEGIPIQHITNKKEFMGLFFYVDKNVLIPRNDTEILVENVLEYIKYISKEKQQINIIDMCTGSGCINISLAYYLKELGLNNKMKIYAVDISEKALEVAKKNASLNEVENYITFIQSDLLDNLPKSLMDNVDVFVSNPPYIRTDEIPNLIKEVKDFEPIIALDGGKDGFDFYRKIIEQSKKYLKQDSKVFFEIGNDQGNEMKELMQKNNFEDILVKKDLGENDRIVIGRYKNV